MMAVAAMTAVTTVAAMACGVYRVKGIMHVERVMMMDEQRIMHMKGVQMMMVEGIVHVEAVVLVQ